MLQMRIERLQLSRGSMHRNVWTSHGPDGSVFGALVIDPVTPSTLCAGTFANGVFKSTDAGATWKAVSTGLPTTPSGTSRTGQCGSDQCKHRETFDKYRIYSLSTCSGAQFRRENGA